MATSEPNEQTTASKISVIEEKINKIIEILLENEDELSDGYDFYIKHTGDFDEHGKFHSTRKTLREKLTEIAQRILRETSIIQLNSEIYKCSD